MSINDIIAQGITITIQGVLTVFLILVLIMLVIYAMTVFMNTAKKKEEAPKTEPVAIEPATEEETIDEGELIAVITAAVAACMGQSAASVNIKSYKKISAWGSAAKREILDNRF